VLAESSLPSAVTPTESMTSFGYGERVAYMLSLASFCLLPGKLCRTKSIHQCIVLPTN